MSDDPEIQYFSDYGEMYLFRMNLRWEVFEAYKRQITPDESKFRIISHVWDAIMGWCEKHARGRWWTDHILGIAFADEGDAIRFKLTFCRPNYSLDRMFTERKHTYSEH